jgi:tripartite-type tricarboxylate transporter receptor subunit TctC
MIVPFAPGGASDVMARLMAEPLRAVLGQPVIIENISGATGSIGVGRAVRAPADGYTLNIGTISSHVLAGALYTLRFDLLKDLQPIAALVSEPILIVGRKDMPTRNLKELITWLKANPDKASQGHAGVGGASRHRCLLSAGDEYTFSLCPIGVGGAALPDLLAGHTDLEMEPVSNFLEQIRGGNLKPYAIAGSKRISVAPDIPTVDEAGLPGFHRLVWVGLWMPKGASSEVIRKVTTAVQTVLAEPGLRARVSQLGQEIFPREQQTPDGLAALQRSEIEKWWPIIKAAGIKAE